MWNDISFIIQTKALVKPRQTFRIKIIRQATKIVQ